jgi:hypothetical protein
MIAIFIKRKTWIYDRHAQWKDAHVKMEDWSETSISQGTPKTAVKN